MREFHVNLIIFPYPTKPKQSTTAGAAAAATAAERRPVRQRRRVHQVKVDYFRCLVCSIRLCLHASIGVPSYCQNQKVDKPDIANWLNTYDMISATTEAYRSPPAEIVYHQTILIPPPIQIQIQIHPSPPPTIHTLSLESDRLKKTGNPAEMMSSLRIPEAQAKTPDGITVVCY